VLVLGWATTRESTVPNPFALFAPPVWLCFALGFDPSN